MNEFLVVLSIVYSCNAAAVQARLDTAEIIRCSVANESAKTHFLSEEERSTLDLARGQRRAEMMREARLRLRDWERTHPYLIRDLKAGRIPALY